MHSHIISLEGAKSPSPHQNTSPYKHQKRPQIQRRLRTHGSSANSRPRRLLHLPRIPAPPSSTSPAITVSSPRPSNVQNTSSSFALPGSTGSMSKRILLCSSAGFMVIIGWLSPQSHPSDAKPRTRKCGRSPEAIAMRRIMLSAPLRDDTGSLGFFFSNFVGDLGVV
ncbi:hypothetical protein EDB19DRAFT_1783094 [Suillus lakei]|nr:hypothetical protein EDB19DRAFT_1783094 [Suillus lakei]